jgi:flagellar basal-body rod protein FlgB
MKSISNHLNFHASALQLRSRRNNILASNIANAATPNFKARDLNYDQQIRQVDDIGPLKSTDNKHFKVAVKNPHQTLFYRQPINPSLDGNTVELSVEQPEFSENSVRYQTSLEFLNNRIAGLLSAIRGE